MSRDVKHQQTGKLLQARSEPTTVAFPRLVGYGYFVAVFIAMVTVAFHRLAFA
jgi:hypothetical protein